MADLDRAAYLDRVADRLHLDPETEAEVLDELRAHLDDSTRNLMLAGFAADDAERRALRNLGDPDTLADSLRRAHRGSRRLLAAVGGGVRGAAEGARSGFAVIFIILLVAGFLGLAVAWAMMSALPGSSGLITGGGPLDPLLRLVSVVPIAFGASRRATLVVTREARQPIVRAALAVGAIGGGLLAVILLFVLDLAIDTGVVIVEIGVVIAWLAGAASVGRIPDITISRRMWIALVLGVALLYAVDLVAGSVDPTGL